MRIIDLEKYDKDPLDLIEKHKDMVEHIRRHGADGMVIREILVNWYGYSITVPITGTRKATDYAQRHITALLNSDSLTAAEKKKLSAMRDRLSRERAPGAVKLMVHPKEKDSGFKPAISWTQALGFQVVPIYDYIKQHSDGLLQKDIFEFMAELFSQWHGGNFTKDQIKYFYKNNC